MNRHSTAALSRPGPGRVRLSRRTPGSQLTCASIFGVARGAALVAPAAVSLLAAPQMALASASDARKDYWQKRYRNLKRLVASVESELEQKRSVYSRERHNGRLRGDARTDLLQEIANLEKRLAKAERDLLEFPDAARKAGAQPGWFRDL
jgi:septal ring factor EnvC (AmiA/AmiB activator)